MRIHPASTVTIVVGALGLAGCGGSPSVAPPSVTSPASVASAPEPAPTLQWESVLTLDDSTVASLAATSVGTFVVAAPHRAGQCDPTPMWSDVSAASLAPVDVDAAFGPGASIMQVASGGPGAIAAGCLPDPDRLVVWTSADGATWTLSETGYRLPEAPERFWVGSLAASTDGAVIAGGEFTDIQVFADTIEKAAMKRMPASLRPYAEENMLVEPQRASTTIGPFTAWSASLDELGVDDRVRADYEAAIAGGGGSPVTVTTQDFRAWTVTREDAVPDLRNATIAATDGGFLATSWNDMTTAPTVYASTDAVTWSPVLAPIEIGSAYMPTSAGDRVLLTTDSREEGIGLWETTDLGSTWTALEPAPAGYWGTPAVGPMGYLAATSVEAPQNGAIEFTFEQGSLVLTVSLGMNGGSVRLVDGGTTIVDDGLAGDWRMPFAPPSLVFHNGDGEMAVVDAATGDEVMRVPYAEVQTAYDAAVMAAGIGTASAAFSADGRSWSQAPLPVPPDRFGGAGPVGVGTDAAWVAASRSYGVSEVVRGTLP